MGKFVQQNTDQSNVDYYYPKVHQPRHSSIDVTSKHSGRNEKVTQQCANRLKLLSYNLQVGIRCKRYSDYVTQSWRHILPDTQRQVNLSQITKSLSGFDMVALQEVDSGSIRTNYIDQVAFLARQSGFSDWYQQKNRELGPIAAHSNGFISKHPAINLVKHKLPGITSGRGALEASFGNKAQPLTVLSVHLSLRESVRRMQFAYMSELLVDKTHFIIMGDMNCQPSEALREFSKRGLAVKSVNHSQATFPRWQPKYHFDQIWVSKNLSIKDYQVMSFGVSDHLPVAIEVEVPDQVGLFSHKAPRVMAH
jgi:endonuclease/exonuclease/phosphatase family metal-dependent hydrolase